jgi:hypothetical protein
MFTNTEESKQGVIGQLQNGLVVVEFTKKNGEFRRMTCTLSPDYVPPKTNITESTKKPNPNNCSVWDVDAQGWRSFIWDNVTDITSFVENQA